jgi:hypothetical protein
LASVTSELCAAASDPHPDDGKNGGDVLEQPNVGEGRRRDLRRNVGRRAQRMHGAVLVGRAASSDGGGTKGGVSVRDARQDPMQRRRPEEAERRIRLAGDGVVDQRVDGQIDGGRLAGHGRNHERGAAGVDVARLRRERLEQTLTSPLAERHPVLLPETRRDLGTECELDESQSEHGGASSSSASASAASAA